MKKFLVLLLVVMLLAGCSKPASNVESGEDTNKESNEQTNEKVTEQTSDNSSLKKFDDIYSGDLIPALDYFNNNIDKFSEEEKLNFAKKIVGVVETSGMKYSQYGEFEFTRAEGFESAPPFIISSDMFDFYEYESNEFNLEYFKNNDNHYLPTLNELKDDKLFTVCALFWADSSNLEGGYFGIALKPEVFKKIIPALKVFYKENYGEFNLPVKVPNMIFETVEKVINDKNVKYPKVLVNNFDEVKKFDGAETWKTEICLPVNFVNKEIPKKSETIHANTLSIGDIIDGHKIESIELSQDKFSISLNGIYKLNGKLYYDEEYWGGYVFYPIVENTTKIEFEFYDTEDSKETFSIEPPNGSFLVEDSLLENYLENDIVQKIKNGESMNVSVKIDGYNFGAYYRSEPYWGTAFESITIESGNKTDTVHASTLNVGDIIDGHRINRIDLSNDKFMISLEGIYEVSGELHYDADYWGGYVFYPIVENTTEIEFDFYHTEDSKETFSIEPPSGSFLVDDSLVENSLGKDNAKKIKNGEIMIVTAKMNGYGFGAHYESEGYNDTIFESIIIDGTKNDSDATLKSENKFESETINGEFIDYNQYTAVIVPMYSGINYGEWAPLEMKEVRVSDNDNNEVNFAVFGTMKNVTITNIENVGDAGTSEHIDIITDSKVRVFCRLPNDMSYAKVTGYVEVGSEEQKVEFTLDDMRDSSEYKVLLFK